MTDAAGVWPYVEVCQAGYSMNFPGLAIAFVFELVTGKMLLVVKKVRSDGS